MWHSFKLRSSWILYPFWALAYSLERQLCSTSRTCSIVSCAPVTARPELRAAPLSTRAELHQTRKHW